MFDRAPLDPRLGDADKSEEEKMATLVAAPALEEGSFRRVPIQREPRERRAETCRNHSSALPTSWTLDPPLLAKAESGLRLIRIPSETGPSRFRF